MYSTPWCPYCVGARNLLNQLGVDYREIRVDQDIALRREMMELSGRRTVPQIWIGATHVGGYTDLLGLQRSGKLDALLETAGGHQPKKR